MPKAIENVSKSVHLCEVIKGGIFQILFLYIIAITVPLIINKKIGIKAKCFIRFKERIIKNSSYLLV